MNAQKLFDEKLTCKCNALFINNLLQIHMGILASYHRWWGHAHLIKTQTKVVPFPLESHSCIAWAGPLGSCPGHKIVRDP